MTLADMLPRLVEFSKLPRSSVAILDDFRYQPDWETGGEVMKGVPTGVKYITLRRERLTVKVVITFPESPAHEKDCQELSDLLDMIDHGGAVSISYPSIVQEVHVGEFI